MLRKILLLLPVFCLLVACAAAPQPAGNATPVASPTPGSKAPLPLDDLLIEFQRSGGIMGRQDIWRIYADGRVETGNPDESLRGPAQDAAVLRELLLRLDIAALSKVTPKPPTCADCFNFTVTLYEPGSTYTYSFTHTPGSSSPAEEEIAAAFAAFLRKAGGKL